jgi:SAM-dependent methyltransferase
VPGNLDRVYGPETWAVYEKIDQSLEPRGPDTLHDIAAEYVRPGATILDAGCRDAAHLIRLVQAHDARGVGVDPVALHIERAHDAVATAGLGDRIELVHGTIEELSYPDGHFDFVWCRDVVSAVANLPAALSALARLLAAEGRLLVYTVFATELLEPGEAAILNRSLGRTAPANTDEAYVESQLAAAGLEIARKEVIGTEWREYQEERTRPASKALLRLARLRRQRDAIVAAHGQDVYDHVQGSTHWEVFQILGKLEPVVYVLKRR